MNWQYAIETTLENLVSFPQLGLISDVDGTLSPIVEHARDAQITERNREFLGELTKELELVALVSGRAAEDVYQRVRLPEITYVGNHGLDRWEAGNGVISPEALVFRSKLDAAYDDLLSVEEDGVWVEDKGATLSLHFRQHEAPEAFSTRVSFYLKEIASKNDLQLSTGRMVFEFKPPLSVDKGSVLRELVKERGLKAALFLGDDTPDVAAFLAARQMREEGVCEAWGIAVQSDETPEALFAAADFFAEGVADVEAFLDWLLTARRASST